MMAATQGSGLPLSGEHQERVEIGRNRIRQIFRFLKDFNGLRNPVKRQISEQPWALWIHDLPIHPCVWLRGRDVADERRDDDEDSGEVLLRVGRPEIPPVPAVPTLLSGWLPSNWKDSAVRLIDPLPERQVAGPRGTEIERFDAVGERVRAFAQWRVEREKWATEALPAQQALQTFNRFYELQGRLEREGESVQLVLGQGILVWRQNDGDIRHPIVIQRLQLSFDPFTPEFKISETAQPPELIRPLLFVSQDVAAQTIQKADEEITTQDLDLLDIDKMEGPLRRVATALHSEGRFIKEGALKADTNGPQIICDPVIYVHRRAQGFAIALEYVLEDLQQRAELPAGLIRISGIDPPLPEVHVAENQHSAWEQPPEILFTKEANDEQFQIADRLERYRNVLVQGPPGTGKTHTIANLIGHLLAQGKRVLVTAHTSKALRVLRDKVVEPLQTLCVSVLDNETESRKQLEASVDAMVARLTSDDPAILDREAEKLETERGRSIAELSGLRRALIDARQDEYRHVLVGGIPTAPSSAARFVAETKQQNAWIPGPIEAGAAAPLSDKEVEELYGTNDRIPDDVEIELSRWRPAPGEAVGAGEFASECERWRILQESDKRTGAALWSEGLYDATSEELAAIQEKIRDSIDLLTNVPGWKLDAMGAGLTGQREAVAPWEELAQRLEKLHLQSQSSLGLLLDYRCTLSPDVSPEVQRVVIGEIRSFVDGGGKLTAFRLMTKPAWRKLITTARVNDGQPETVAHFRALEVFAGLQETRLAMGTRWTNQITRRQGPRWEEFGDKPEEGAVLSIPTLRALLGWHSQILQPLVKALQNAGFKWDDFLNAQDVQPGEHMELRRLVNSVIGPLPGIVAARVNLLEFKQLDRRFSAWNRTLFSPEAGLLPASAVLDLRVAVGNKDYRAYDLAYRRLADLHLLAPIFQRRRELLGRLGTTAPAWAAAIQNRMASHNESQVPGSTEEAWRWLQFVQELDRRAGTSISDIQNKIHDLESNLRRITARLIEVRSWSAQCKRVGLGERQALQGWKDINRRIGRGTGQRAPGLRAQARQTLAKARNAVPVWIMPLSRVAETFDPRTARFDVVIVDEASQCDVLGLLALYLAERAVVVGDHEQVSPLAIGQEIAEVEQLIAQHLSGIPNNILYDGKMSLYDLARQSFGGLIRLLEHFRCVPEIISFSNALSYNGDIKALRDPTSTYLAPSVVGHCVAGVRNNGKINEEEARAVAGLIQAALEQPEYKGKTFGVVSLLGEEQAIEIEKLVRQICTPHELAAAKFLCGTAAQFQGDERDVIFVSMVDSPAEGPLRMRQEDLFRQRFNVAASRPKDQLWVIHSLDHQRDLQPGDLRRRLIEHAENPSALIRQQLGLEGRTESEFEKLVLRRLVAAGFRVRPQWVVGRYRIDLVVESSGGRLAVECDGDRFHPIEQVAEDMARQAVLERIGWRFARIRGSQFFRDPDAAMRPVFETLARFEILPEGQVEFSATADTANDVVNCLKRRAEEILHELDEHLQKDPDNTMATPGL
jgi:very-short-patch-repair endonuclease